jgi:small subunit ribosomal protein S5
LTLDGNVVYERGSLMGDNLKLKRADVNPSLLQKLDASSPTPIESNTASISTIAIMASPRQYQCLSCRLKTSIHRTTRQQRRQFHASPPKPRKSPYPNFKPSDLETPSLRPYTQREKELLAMKYSPEQMKVIEAGEAAISAEDIATQGRMRQDPMRIKYLDDFSTMRPVLDRPMTAAERKGAPQELVEGANESTRGRTKNAKKDVEDEEQVDPHMLRLSQQTGMTIDEIKRIRVKNLVAHRVVNQTRMGKIQSLYYLTIAGNQNGMVGIGEGKAVEDEDGRRQAMMAAIRNMKPIARYEERTIYGEVEGKVGAAVVKLSSRPPGEFDLRDGYAEDGA